MNFVTLFTCFLGFIATCSAGPGDRYARHKVIEMVAGSNSSASMMKKFINQQKKDMDIWLQTAFQCQVQIPDSKMEEVKAYCDAWNITLTVKIDNLKVAIDKQLEDNELIPKRMRLAKNPFHRRRLKSTFNYTRYNRFGDIVNELHRLQCKYPSLLDVVYVGRSYEGRPLLLVKITQNVLSDCSENKKVIWIDGGTHAREWISVASPMYMIHELVTKFGKDRNITNLLKNNAVFVAPVINPDGYEYTFTDDRLWRKSRTPNPGSKCIGTDPNRNWDIMWGGVGSSSDPCANDYHGSAPESEPVIKAYAKVLRYLQGRLKFFISLHSFAQALLIPNSYTIEKPKDIDQVLPPAFTFFRTTSKKFGKFYVFGNAPMVLRQTLTGVSLDYVHDVLKVPFSYLLELRPPPSNPIGFLLPADQIAPTTQEVFCGILEMLKKVDELV